MLLELDIPAGCNVVSTKPMQLKGSSGKSVKAAVILWIAVNLREQDEVVCGEVEEK